MEYMDTDIIRKIFDRMEDDIEALTILVADARGHKDIEPGCLKNVLKMRREQLEECFPHWHRWPQETPPDGWHDAFVCIKIYDEDGEVYRYVIAADCCSWRADTRGGNPFGHWDQDAMIWTPIPDVTHWMLCPFPALPLEDE